MNKLRLVEILGNDGCWHKTKFSQIVKGDVYRLFDTDGPLPCIENGMPTVALADAQETDGICGVESREIPQHRHIKTTATIEEVLELLNSAVKLDPDAMKTLVETRVPCNKALANHPSIQVLGVDPEGSYSVGILGILNAIFGANDQGWGAIAANFEVNCPNGHSTLNSATIYDHCSQCGTQLVLGKLIEFIDLGKH